MSVSRGVITKTAEAHVLQPSNDAELTAILQNLADPVKTSSQTSFKREFGQLKSKYSEPGLWTYHKNLAPVVQRCCNEKKFWPAAELEYLIRMQCILHRDIVMVFKTLAEKKEVGMMYHALKSQPGGEVPENCLLIALQCFLSTEEEILEKAQEECQPAVFSHCSQHACPLSTARRAFVDQVLDAPYDEVYLISSLKKLPFEIVLDLLEYVVYRINTSGVREANKLLEWKAHIVDAHSTHMILANKAHELLVEYSKEQELTDKFSTQAAEDVLALLKLTAANNTNKSDRATTTYRIETLHL